MDTRQSSLVYRRAACHPETPVVQQFGRGEDAVGSGTKTRHVLSILGQPLKTAAPEPQQQDEAYLARN